MRTGLQSFRSDAQTPASRITRFARGNQAGAVLPDHLPEHLFFHHPLSHFADKCPNLRDADDEIK